MCDPITVASIAASVIGTGLQMKAQSNARKEQQAIIRRNDENNTKLMDDNAKALAEAREGFKRSGEAGFDSALSNDIAALATKYQDVQSGGQVPGEFGQSAVEAPEVVKEYESQKRGQASDFTKKYAAALAGLSGFDETMFGRNLKTARAGEKFDMNRSFMAGNNNVAQQQLAGVDSSSPLGDLLTMAGSFGTAYGLKAPSAAPVPGTIVTKPGPLPWLNPNTPGMPNFGGLY